MESVPKGERDYQHMYDAATQRDRITSEILARCQSMSTLNPGGYETARTPWHNEEVELVRAHRDSETVQAQMQQIWYTITTLNQVRTGSKRTACGIAHAHHSCRLRRASPVYLDQRLLATVCEMFAPSRYNRHTMSSTVQTPSER